LSSQGKNAPERDWRDNVYDSEPESHHQKREMSQEFLPPQEIRLKP